MAVSKGRFVYFSIIELLVVIGVLSILAAILLPVFKKCLHKASAITKYSSCVSGNQNKNSGCIGHWTFGEGGGNTSMDWASGRSCSITFTEDAGSNRYARWESFSRHEGDWASVPGYPTPSDWFELNEDKLRGKQVGILTQDGGSALIKAPSLVDTPDKLSVEVWVFLASDVVQNQLIKIDDSSGFPVWDIGVTNINDGFYTSITLPSNVTLLINLEIGLTDKKIPNVPESADGSVGSFKYRWHHLVLTYDTNDAMKFYVNGVLVGSEPEQGPLRDSNGSISLATSIGAAVIGELAIYDRILGKDEVVDNYNSGKPEGYDEASAD